MSSLSPVQASPTVPPAAKERAAALGPLATLVLIVVVLSRAQAIFVPLALAIVIAFAVGPVVRRLERAVGRIAAVAVVVVVGLAAAGGFSYSLERQVVGLSAEMTKYSGSIQRKMIALRGSDSSGLGALAKSVDRAVRNLDEQVGADQGGATGSGRPRAGDRVRANRERPRARHGAACPCGDRAGAGHLLSDQT